MVMNATVWRAPVTGALGYGILHCHYMPIDPSLITLLDTYIITEKPLALELKKVKTNEAEGK